MKKQMIDFFEKEGVMDKTTADYLRIIEDECVDNIIKAQLMLVIIQLENLINTYSSELKVQIQSRIELAKVLISKLPNQVYE
jgi:hypothetical protein